MVIDILEEKVGVPSTTPSIHTATWEDLGVESLGLTEVYSNLEQTLSIVIPDDQASEARNIQELVALINEYIVTWTRSSNS